MTVAVLCGLAAAAAAGIVEGALATEGFKHPWRRWSDLLARIRMHRQRERARRQWPQALLYLSGAVNAGATLDEAFDHLGHEAPEPLASQVRLASRAGSATLEARIKQAMSDPHLRFARAALVLHAHTGGRVARILETTAAVLQERIEMEGRVRALTAQGRASAWIVSLTPLALGGALAVLAPDLLRPMFETVMGRLVLGVVVVLVGVGLVLALRLSRVATE